MLWNGSADLLEHSIGWTSNGVWCEMKWNFDSMWLLELEWYGKWWCTEIFFDDDAGDAWIQTVMILLSVEE
jgi:hypothetical protein